MKRIDITTAEIINKNISTIDDVTLIDNKTKTLFKFMSIFKSYNRGRANAI